MTQQNQPTTSDADFIAMFEREGPALMSRQLGVALSNIYSRRRNLEAKLKRQITGPNKIRTTRNNIEHPHRFELSIKDGFIIIGSDAHYWPNRITTAHRALVHLAKELQPKAIVMNGDVLDGASISRHPPIGWEERPALIDELQACQDRLSEIERAAPNAKKIWTLGNHDGRFETRLATVAPEYAKVNGVHLKDHFPYWHPCWSAWINDEIVVKHRYKNGTHATHNATVNSGKTIVTGHLHSLKVTPFTDYNGTRWGVDTGTLAEPDGPQFIDYCEDNPTNWRSGFVVLTFHKGKLLWPDVVHVTSETEVTFQGRVIKV
tara:strand:- start:2093 stop:3049 length:957 start_codon:yes stop_codon:yes gene_type:complete